VQQYELVPPLLGPKFGIGGALLLWAWTMEQTGANRTQTVNEKCHGTHTQTDSRSNCGLQFTALCDVILCSLVDTA